MTDQNPLKQAAQALISAAGALLGHQNAPEAPETPPEGQQALNRQEQAASGHQHTPETPESRHNAPYGPNQGQQGLTQGQPPQIAPQPATAPAGPPAGVTAPALTLAEIQGMTPKQINDNWAAVGAAMKAQE